MRISQLRPSPGALIGTIALVFAFTGAAGAASNANKVQTNDIAKRAVTGKKIARDSVKSGKIADGKVKEKDLADGVIPTVPEQAYGRVDKDGVNVAPAEGAVGITGVADAGPGTVCYDLAFEPVSGTASAVRGPASNPGATVEVIVKPTAGCVAPYTDAATTTKNSTNGNPVDNDVYVDFVR